MPEPKVDIVYIYVHGKGEYSTNVIRFIDSYHKFPPDYPHGTIVMCNGGVPDPKHCSFLGLMPKLQAYPYNNDGQDIGAHLAASRISKADMCVYFGSNIHFFRRGWLRRMVDAWVKYGPGVYCSSTSYEVTCHFNTTGFWCDRTLMEAYPFPIHSKEDRYNFEHGRANFSQNIDRPDTRGFMTFWKLCYHAGYPVVLVTWDGEYDWWNWRKPANIFRRGDQSNMLIHWKHTDLWAQQRPNVKAIWSKSTDSLTDPTFNLAARTFR